MPFAKNQELTAIDSEEYEEFDTIRQGKATNQLTKLTDAAGYGFNDITGEALLKNDDIKVFIDKYEQMQKCLSPTTYRLLDALTMQFTKNGSNSTLIQLPLTEYMDRCGLKDIKSARKQVKIELDNLYRLSLEWNDKENGKNKDYAKTRICDSVGIKKGVIIFNLTLGFYSYLSKAHIMPYPKQLYKIDAHHNPHSFYFLRKIAEHKNMNKGKTNEDIISVKTLLEAAPLLPKYNDLVRAGRIKERIIEPFERDMDNLEDTLTWEYTHRNGKALTENELNLFNYTIFSELMIKITWKEYPERMNNTPTKPKTKNKKV